MNDDVFYDGFFYVEVIDNKALKIRLYPHYTMVEELRREGTWYEGDLSIRANGTFVEMNIINAYGVEYSWGGFPVELAANIARLVYIDPPVTEKTWFGLSSKTFYRDATRYIRQITDFASFRRFYNLPLQLTVDQ